MKSAEIEAPETSAQAMKVLLGGISMPAGAAATMTAAAQGRS